MSNKNVFKSAQGRQEILTQYDQLLSRWPVQHQKLQVDTRYGSTFVIASGNPVDKPLILLHGSSTNTAMWMGDVTHLSESYHVFAVDIIGEPGHSAEVRPKLEPINYAAWLEDLLRGLGLSSASFVGNSLGGWLALCFATTKPELVDALVLISTSGIAHAKLSFLFKVIPLGLMGQWGLDRINRIVYGGLQIPSEVTQFGNLVYRNFNPRMGELYVFQDDELKRLSMPILFIAGQRDALLPTQKSAERLGRLVPTAKIKVIPDRGHVIIDCAKEIATFLG